MLLPYLRQGGPMMLLLVACSVALGAVLIEHAVAVAGYRWRVRHRRRAATDAPFKEPPRHRLKFFWDVPPQIGLLGTVLGLVEIFSGDLSAEAFGRGVGTACFTTVFGLALAIIARVAHYVFAGLTPDAVDPVVSPVPKPIPAPAPSAPTISSPAPTSNPEPAS